MKKEKTRPVPAFLLALVPWINFVWLIPAVGVWIWEQFWHAGKGEPFSLLLFLKGLVLLATASAIFHLSARAFRGFSFLGFLPLLWLSASKCQWDLCAAPAIHHWFWLVLFLALEVILLTVPDGKILIYLLAPLWGVLSWLEPFSSLLPLGFLTVSDKRLRHSEWLRWGGLVAVGAYFVLFQQWKDLGFDWLDSFDLFGTKKFVAFLLVGWLGGVAFPPKGVYRHLVFPLLWLTIGSLVLPGGEIFLGTSLLQWVLIFFAGFGWESFRRDLMDPTWHGRLVWLALGLSLTGGVI